MNAAEAVWRATATIHFTASLCLLYGALAVDWQFGILVVYCFTAYGYCHWRGDKAKWSR